MTDTVEQVPVPLDVRSVGTRLARVDGPEKVTGRARYAVEHRDEEGLGDPLSLWLVQSTVAKGEVEAVDASAALAHDGVLRVLDHTSAPRLEDTEDGELAVLQDARVHFRGQIVAVVVAETSEAAREGAALVEVSYRAEPHAAAFTVEGATYRPDSVNPAFETDSDDGDVDAALAGSAVVVDASYGTPYEHNNPMEPHATIARWHEGDDDGVVLRLVDSTQGVHGVASTIAPMVGLGKDQVHVTAPYVGGGFGSKGLPHANVVVAALAARETSPRPVSLAVTRQQMFALTGYRTATVSRMRLGADRDGRLTAIEHRAYAQSAAVKEFAEQTAVGTRSLYAAANRRTSHRLAVLDVAVPSWMRAPGEMPGIFAHEVAMDELAVACGVDPVELRVRNIPERDPETGKPFSDHRLVECLREGAERFGWADRPAQAGATLDGEWRVGTGMAVSTYPGYRMPGNEARVTALDGGRFEVAIGCVDIGTGARTVLTQIAADALGVDPAAVVLRVADSSLPPASVAGGSSGTASWGSAVSAAAQAFLHEHGRTPDPGASLTASAADDPLNGDHVFHSHGAVFAEVRVHRRTGEIRVPRLFGMYSVGRVMNPTTARSQLVGGLVMGLSSALHEESVRDPRFGHVVTQDLATYHVASHADVLDVDADWLEGSDEEFTPMGARGIGEIGIVGTAAAVINAAYHATGVRVRDLPVTADRFLGEG
ncbi:xanthine dehydrogenase family protein molybdopterin-binding subunit [Phycicoccus sp. BSK3Z-2]|uniref:Xanthine dehydrogenase family protein molybdopterin-binding subunit n=1 Tax=Phycicoccus avicenniae TaxID=2828860 RepID=A0A941DC23_9MICO|nr:xanthine dehydrogenase family protein molybdopterin-binding subunit [Phycicoccus avicenniae]MBR7744690.1 xanthine dehydrogenase family protein molybdopterin-binding subunit [Phycicoccus avicenniae]